MRRAVHFINLIRRPTLQSCSVILRQMSTAALERRLTAPSFSTILPEFANDPELNNHTALYQYSIDKPTEFWGRLATSRLRWHRHFDKILESNINNGQVSWFSGGVLNVTDNCVDRHFEVDPERIALIWEKDEPGEQEYVTYRQLYEMMNQLANTLKSRGIRRHDRVVIYLPACPMAIAAMLACARIGAVHSVVFAGFSSAALATRIQDSEAETVITSDIALRGGKTIDLKRVVDDAVASCPTVKRVFVTSRSGKRLKLGKLDIDLDKEMVKQSTECSQEPMESEDLLFLLYTSGSTGKPKGIAHTQAGYLLFASLTHQLVFDYSVGDVFGCVADIGWITGHSYVVYGPLCNGATTVLFESTPTYPDAGRYWETVQRLSINQFYCAPTAIRLLMQYDSSFVTKYDLSSLHTIGSVGEPLNHDAWLWYNELVGEKRCPIVDTWWQTETGGIMISPRPSEPEAEILPAMPMRPFYGIEVALLDRQGNERLQNDAYGALCIKQIWPGIARTIYGNHQRYIETYFNVHPGYYMTGDGAHRVGGKYYRITGRIDDVINTSGHRIGTAEIEDVLDEHPLVAESAVVGYPHDIKGEGIYAFVTLKNKHNEDENEIKKDMMQTVRKQIAAYAVPDVIQMVRGLPKTRSGKIMRRILRQIVLNKADQLGDISTLADPSVVDDIVKDNATLRAQFKPVANKK